MISRKQKETATRKANVKKKSMGLGMVLITANIFIIQDISVEPKNTTISPNFLVWESCGKAQFLHSFVRFA